MEALIFPILSLLLFLLFTEVLTVNIVHSNGWHLELELTLVGIHLYPQRRSRALKKRKKRKGKINNPRKTAATRKSLLFLLSKTNVEIKKLQLNTEGQDFARATVLNGVAYSLIYGFFNLIQRFSKKFNTTNIIVTHSDNNKNSFELYITLEVPVLYIIGVPFVYIKEYLLNQRGYQNV